VLSTPRRSWATYSRDADELTRPLELRDTMQALRNTLWTAFGATSKATPRQATRAPFLRFRQRHQTRLASNYQRFGQQSSSNGAKSQNYSRIGPVYRVQYIWRNYRTPIIVVSSGGVVVYVSNQETVPVSGRRRFNVVSHDLEKQISGGQYEGLVDEFKGKIFPENHPYTQMVARVVERLLPSVGGLAEDEWRVHVIDEPNQRNAFVIPGGKVFVFSGILPICKDEDGLAAVLGHEIAHNVAHHVSERISRGGVTALVAILFSLVFDVSGQMAQSVASLLLSLPNSRTQEQEADHIGLLMMAQSCYDPRAAIDLWTRMAEAEKGAPPQFLSTHPTSYNRRELIRGWMPEAEQKYNEAECALTSRYTQNFKQAFGAANRSQMGRPQRIPVQQAGRPPRSDDDDDFF
jgi:metalloendopeptidase OMA1, mitochondrial